jgi:hypothetical protein
VYQVKLTSPLDKDSEYFDVRLNVTAGYAGQYFTITSESIPVPTAERVG